MGKEEKNISIHKKLSEFGSVECLSIKEGVLTVFIKGKHLDRVKNVSDILSIIQPLGFNEQLVLMNEADYFLSVSKRQTNLSDTQ